ncbi:hypothetical protein scyTo_0001757 [Scyliorhinus torazame]|uniref:DDE Tnp4 domain-containing protein n=1 Tax=Scyliorhinus torazame TaxID=75743 RepID=A0A401PFM9_SCYTO|nr:hypothetical protein [Scyliorhinus torazame]
MFKGQPTPHSRLAKELASGRQGLPAEEVADGTYFPATGRRKTHYNDAHTVTRSMVEQCFGLLKMRFRCLDRSGGAIQYEAERVARIVVACCTLHNIAQQKGDVLEEDEKEGQASSNEDDVEERDDEQDMGPRQAGVATQCYCQGQRTRDALIASKFTD